MWCRMSEDGEGVQDAQVVQPYLRVDAAQLTVLADAVANHAQLAITRLIEHFTTGCYRDQPTWVDVVGRNEPYLVVKLPDWLRALLDEVFAAGGDLGLVVVPDADPEMPEYVVGVKPRPVAKGCR